MIIDFLPMQICKVSANFGNISEKFPFFKERAYYWNLKETKITLESISANPKFSAKLQKISDWQKKAYNN